MEARDAESQLHVETEAGRLRKLVSYIQGNVWVVCVIFEVKGKIGAVFTKFEVIGKLGNHGEAMGCLCHF